jgi:hypothetical protein
METAGRKRRIGVALGGLAGGILAMALWGVRPSPLPPPPVSLGPPPPSAAAAPVTLDLDRLYDLDHLVVVGDPRLDLRTLAPVGAGPPEPAVPEPGPATLWILGFAALCTLYLPARSW